MLISAYIFGLLAVLFTTKPLIRHSAWYIRLGDFPRLQILGVAIVSLVLFAFSGVGMLSLQTIFFGLVAACAAFQVYAIFPFTFLHKREVQKAKKSCDNASNISLLIFNVLMENDAYDEVSRLILERRPDVVLLAEPDAQWYQGLTRLRAEYPFEVAHLLDNHYGMILLSRLELDETKTLFLIQDDIPSIHTKLRLPSGQKISFHGVHPRPPVPEERGRSTERDGELLLVGKMVRESALPCIVAGDMNDSAWSRTTKLFKRISGLLDPRVGRGFYNTFHANYKLFRLPLDHIFHSNDFRLVELERIKNSCGSDHFPVFVKLSLEHDAAYEQPKPHADAAENDEAHELIEEALRENS